MEKRKKIGGISFSFICILMKKEDKNLVKVEEKFKISLVGLVS